jgi:HEAT repeat protein
MDRTRELFHQQALTADELQALVDAEALDPRELARKRLWDGRLFMRRNAAEALARGAVKAGELSADLAGLVIIAAKDIDPEVRASVARALGRAATPPPVTLDALLRLAVDPNQDVRAAAREALAELVGATGDAFIEPLVGALSLPLPAARNQAAQLLLGIGDAATAALIQATPGLDPERLAPIIDVLLQIGIAAAPALVEALEAPNTRALAANLLVQLHGFPPETLQVLEALSAREDASLAAAAAAVLKVARAAAARAARPPLVVPVEGFLDGELEPAALETSDEIDVSPEALVAALRDGRAHVRLNAARVLGRRAGAQVDAVRGDLCSALAMATRDDEPRVRRAALEALPVPLGIHAARAVVASLADAEAQVAAAAREALDRLTPAALSELVSAVLADPRPGARETLLAATERAGAELAPGLAGTLIQARAVAARHLAAEALGRTGGSDERTVQALIEALEDPVEVVRLAAITSLGQTAAPDGPALAALRPALVDPSTAIRGAASHAIQHLKGQVSPGPDPAEVAPITIDGFMTRCLEPDTLTATRIDDRRLLRALTDGRAPARHNAALALAGAEVPARAASPLAVIALDGDERVRWAAVTALSRLGAPVARISTRVFVRALRDRAERVAEAASEALRGLGAEALPGLVEALDVDREIAEATVTPLLARLGEPAVAPLLDALEAPSLRVQTNAVLALGRLGPNHAARTRGPIDARRGHPDAGLKGAARQALRDVDGVKPPPSSLEAAPVPIDGFELRRLEAKDVMNAGTPTHLLIRALGDGRALVRHNAALALGYSGEPERAAARLAVAVRDDDARVRGAVMDALAHLGGPAAAVSTPALIRGLRDPSPEVSGAAREALQALAEAAVPGLIEALDDDAGVAAKTVGPALAAIGEAAIAPLAEALGNARANVRANAARTLGSLGETQAARTRGPVSALLDDDDPACQRAARQALRAIDGVKPPPTSLTLDPIDIEGFELCWLEPRHVAKARTDVVRLIRALGDGRAQVRHNAALALGASKDGARAAARLAVAARDDEARVRAAVARALGALGVAEADTTAPALARALSDPDEAVRAAARAALDRLGGAATAPLVRAVRGGGLASGEAALLPFLASLEADAVAPLVEACQDPNLLVRLFALRALAEVGPPAVAARATVEALGVDPHPGVQAAARACLERLDGTSAAPTSLPADPLPLVDFDRARISAEDLKASAKGLDVARLRRALGDGRAQVRENAARALGVIGAPAAVADGDLLLALKDGDVDVQIAAAEATGALGTEAARAAPALLWALERAGDGLSEAIFATIDGYGAAAVEPVLGALDGRPEQVRASVTRVVARAPGRYLDGLSARSEPGWSLVVRENAVEVLTGLGKAARAVAPALGERLLVEQEVILKAKLVAAVMAIAERDHALKDLLRTVMGHDGRAAIQRACKRALARLPRRG